MNNEPRSYFAKCDCRSYNSQVGKTPEVVLSRPLFMSDSERINGVPVDACIAETIQHLWENGVVTLGSCCGHNTETPSIVLGNSERDYMRIKQLISDKDDRPFDLLQWQQKLVNVNNTSQ